jgi:hypothetical protein
MGLLPDRAFNQSNLSCFRPNVSFLSLPLSLSLSLSLFLSLSLSLLSLSSSLILKRDGHLCLSNRITSTHLASHPLPFRGLYKPA